MPGSTFVDTNVLIYAHDADAGDKRAIAAAHLRDLWATRQGALSVQVLQEFYVNVTQKIPRPLSPPEVRDIVRAYCAWPVEVIEPDTALHGSEISQRHRISFWDALIVAAALQGGATKILSEDLNAGQEIEGIVIENPFGSRQRTGRRRRKPQR